MSPPNWTARPNAIAKPMAEIISPEFKRTVKQKLRLLRSNPALERLPEFKKKTSDGTGAIILLIATALRLRKR